MEDAPLFSPQHRARLRPPTLMRRKAPGAVLGVAAIGVLLVLGASLGLALFGGGPRKPADFAEARNAASARNAPTVAPARNAPRAATAANAAPFFAPPMALVAKSSSPLLPSTLDFWMGLLIRLLGIAAVVLAVVEIDLPLCDCPWLRPQEIDNNGYTAIPCDAEKAGETEALEPDGEAECQDGKGEDGKDVKPNVASVGESAIMISAYMVSAIGIVYLNAWLLRKWPFAATLTMFQMVFCSIAARLCVWFKLSDPSNVGMTLHLYIKLCLPLALLYTLYLYGSNAVYKYLEIGYIQLLKPGQAVGVYLLLALAGKEPLHWAPVVNLSVILGAVIVASVAQSEIEGWSTYGFLLMMTSNAAYSAYLVGQQLLLNTALGKGKSVKLDSISTLYFLGPATALGLGIIACATEWTHADFSFKTLNVAALACDCFLAFSLNLIQIRILGKLSALTYMFAGYFKGFLTVSLSVALFNETISDLEAFGYGVMLAGQLLWSLRKLRGKGKPDADGRMKLKVAAACGCLFVIAVYAVTIDACALVPCAGR